MNFEEFFNLMRESRCGLCVEKDKGCKGFDIAGKCEDFKLKPFSDRMNIYYKACFCCENYFNCNEKDNDSFKCHDYKKYIPRCDKCVFTRGICGHHDIHGECITYKRDPPDGGYYG